MADAVEQALGGQWLEIGRLRIDDQIGQSVQLECYCTVTYHAGGAPALAAVTITSVSPHCNRHTFADIGKKHFIGMRTRVWAAPDAPIK